MKMELEIGNIELETKERWKRVIGYNDYVVSNKGRVYSLKSKRLLTQHKHKGYLRVGLSKDGCQRNKRVHILVATGFKQRLEGQDEVNHLDLDKTNNNDWNLEWSTREDNFNHAYENGAIKRGLEHGRNKLTKEQIYAIREDKRNNYVVCEDYGVSANCIRKIKLRLSYSSL